MSDGIAAEFKGIINYAVIGLIQLELPEDAPEEMDIDEVAVLFDKNVQIAKSTDAG
ncbi:MAG: nucleotide modification associated domain-containing protein [Chitinophagaceae bacterium]